MRRWLILLVCLLATGCAYQHSVDSIERWSERLEVIDSHQLQRQRQFVLPFSTRILVAYPHTQVADFPERKLQRALERALMHRFSVVVAGEPANSLSAYRQQAHQVRCQLIIYPRITRWSQDANRWQNDTTATLTAPEANNPDNHTDDKKELAEQQTGPNYPEFIWQRDLGREKIKLDFVLLDVASGRVLDVIHLNTKSSWLDIWRSGGERVYNGLASRLVENISTQR